MTPFNRWATRFLSRSFASRDIIGISTAEEWLEILGYTFVARTPFKMSIVCVFG